MNVGTSVAAVRFHMRQTDGIDDPISFERRVADRPVNPVVVPLAADLQQFTHHCDVKWIQMIVNHFEPPFAGVAK